jgi:hypothetical protein
MGSFIGFRFLCKAYGVSSESLYTDESIAGLFGATPLALGGGSVADMFAEQDRASAMAM